MPAPSVIRVITCPGQGSNALQRLSTFHASALCPDGIHHEVAQTRFPRYATLTGLQGRQVCTTTLSPPRHMYRIKYQADLLGNRYKSKLTLTLTPITCKPSAVTEEKPTWSQSLHSSPFSDTVSQCPSEDPPDAHPCHRSYAPSTYFLDSITCGPEPTIKSWWQSAVNRNAHPL